MTTVPSKYFITVKSYILVHGLFFSLLFSFIKKNTGPMRNQMVLDTLQEIAHEVGAGPVYLVPPSSMTNDDATTTQVMKQKQQTTSRPIIGSQDFVIENERTARTVLRALRGVCCVVMYRVVLTHTNTGVPLRLPPPIPL